MSYANTDERSRLIAGLRELAEFLADNPDVPAPPSTVMFVFPLLDRSDQERRAEINAIASRIYTQAYENFIGHYAVSRYFGPVEYKAIAIDKDTAADSDGE